MRLHKLRSLNEWLIISASFEPDADDSYDSIAVVLKFFHLCCLPIDDKWGKNVYQRIKIFSYLFTNGESVI